MSKLTVEAIEAELRRLAEEHPTATYKGPQGQCGYTFGSAAGRPGCMFGQALHNLGVEWTTLRRFDDNPPDSDIDTVARKLGLSAPNSWAELQESQDLGLPWREVVEVLDRPTRLRKLFDIV